MKRTDNKLLVWDAWSRADEDLIEILETLPIQIFHVSNYNEALALTAEHEFATCIINSEKQPQNIFEYISELKINSSNTFLPFILLCKHAIKEAFVLKHIAAGAVDFMRKPASPHILLGKVNIFLELFNQQQKLKSEIEQRKQTEDRLVNIQKVLKSAKNKAEEADHLKSAFLANMSHEIRTPMNAIVGFSNLIINEELSNEQRILYTRYINSSSNTLLRLIDDIIDIAKIEAGQLKVSKGLSYIQPILRELYKIHSDLIAKSKNPDIILQLDVPENDNRIVIDEFRIRQVITNLLNNAIKFTPNGKITFGYRILQNNQMRFFVKDTGIGIPKDKTENVFNRFVRIENHSLPDASGTGLGLSIAQKMVELHDGNIWVESTEGIGSTFYFSLPYNPLLDRTVQGIGDHEENIEETYTWPDKTVLIAEDEFINFQFLKEILRKTGIKLIWAKNGQEAVDLAVKNQKELSGILMDIKMPELDGYEATVEIKKILPSLPIIAQTAYAMANEREICMKAGFDAYLIKPVNAKILLKTMSECFHMQKVEHR